MSELDLQLIKRDDMWYVQVEEGKEYPPVASKNKAKKLKRLLTEVRDIYK